MTKKYKVYVSSRYRVWNEADNCMDWANEEFDEMLVESHATLKECFDSINNWGSRWVMYPAVYILTDEDGEVWESTPELFKCEHCKHEEWENFTSQTALIGKTYREFEEAVARGL